MPQLSWWCAINKVDPLIIPDNYPSALHAVKGTTNLGCVCLPDITMAKSAKLIQQQLEKEL